VEVCGSSPHGPTIQAIDLLAVAVSPIWLFVDSRTLVADFVAASTTVCPSRSISTAFCFNSSLGWVYRRVIVIEACPAKSMGATGTAISAFTPMAEEIGGVAKAVPIIGIPLNVASTGRDLNQAKKDYNACMGGK
jgi:hypothetical protein